MRWIGHLVFTVPVFSGVVFMIYSEPKFFVFLAFALYCLAAIAWVADCIANYGRKIES